MKIENINKVYLDKALKGESVDYLYHFGISSEDACLEMMKDIKAVVLAGSGHRIKRMAENWANTHDKKSFFKFIDDVFVVQRNFFAAFVLAILFSFS